MSVSSHGPEPCASAIPPLLRFFVFCSCELIYNTMEAIIRQAENKNIF